MGDIMQIGNWTVEQGIWVEAREGVLMTEERQNG